MFENIPGVVVKGWLRVSARRSIRLFSTPLPFRRGNSEMSLEVLAHRKCHTSEDSYIYLTHIFTMLLAR